MSEISAVKKTATPLDLGQFCKRSIYSQKSASIQPRTSLTKFRRIKDFGAGVLNGSARGHHLDVG